MTIRLTHIALLLAVALLAASAGSVISTYFVAKHEFRGVLDHDLKKQSKLLVALISEGQLLTSGSRFPEILTRVFRSGDEEAIWVNVFDTESGRKYSNFSNDVSVTDMEIGEVQLQLDGVWWQGFQRVEDQLVVQLLRSDAHLQEVQGDILKKIATPILIAGGVSLAILAVLIGMTLGPLARFSRELENRSANSLTPLLLRSPAREVMVFRDTLNRLMGEVDSVLNRERQFASDVAHELRTPVTTLKLEIASSDPDREALKSEIDRLANLIDQLLTLARVERGNWTQEFAAVDLGALCAGELRRLSPGLAEAGVEVETRLQTVLVRGDKVLLSVLIQNMVSNVVRHCGRGTRLTIELRPEGTEVVLRFIDDGPGLSDSKLEYLNTGSARFDCRGDGLGVGLSICRKIADIHAARLRFSKHRGGTNGLIVTAIFPELR